MSGLIRRLRADDRGVTLTELLVTILIIGIAGVVFSTVLAGALNATRNAEGASRANDGVRLVLATMDREIRSASQICLPAPEFSANALVFETRATSGATEVVTYRLDDPDGDGVASLVKSVDGGDERVVVDTVVNGFVAAQNATQEFLFTNQGINEEVGVSTTVTGSPSFGKVISVRIWIDTNPRDDISPKLETTELSGRNVWTPNAGCSG